MFEFRKASFDAVALSIEFFVVSSLLFSVGFGWHDGDRTHGLDVVEDGLAVVALVGQHSLRLAFAEQIDSLGTVVDLTAGDEEVDRYPEFVG